MKIRLTFNFETCLQREIHAHQIAYLIKMIEAPDNLL
uniref:Uncharacterized protein n=1 Tax=Anguilla anguilla TaxID=7936 RepID=A0A0E9TL71_ANGAN